VGRIPVSIRFLLSTLEGLCVVNPIRSPIEPLRQMRIGELPEEWREPPP